MWQKHYLFRSANFEPAEINGLTVNAQIKHDCSNKHNAFNLNTQSCPNHGSATIPHARHETGLLTAATARPVLECQKSPRMAPGKLFYGSTKKLILTRVGCYEFLHRPWSFYFLC